jgi:hypothetical protein
MMKFYYLILFCLSQLIAKAQYDVYKGQAHYESGTDGYTISKFTIDIMNNTPYTLTEVKMHVYIIDDYGRMKHDKVHTFKVNIEPFEWGKTPNVPLQNRRILWYYRSFEGLNWEAEILDYKVYKSPAQIQEEKQEAQRQKEEQERLERERIEQARILAEQQALQRKINETLLTANTYYDQNKLREANIYFNEVLQLEPDNREAKRKTKEIDEFFALRAGNGYLYRNDHKSDLDQLKLLLSKELNMLSTQSKDGQISLKINVLFDTNGNNISRIDCTPATTINSKLETLLQQSLRAPQKFGYFVSAHDQIEINLSWKSDQELVISNGEGINGTGSLFERNAEELKKYIESQHYKYGDFTFEIKNKNLLIDGSKTELSDIYFIDYKLNAGPQYAFYSLILPGWGAAKVSSGENGYLTGTAYLLALGAAGLTKIMERADYQIYLDSQTQNDAETAYSAANFDRKLFLMSIGVVGISYVYDFSWSLVRGFSNVQKAHQFKKELKQSPKLVKQASL